MKKEYVKVLIPVQKVKKVANLVAKLLEELLEMHDRVEISFSGIKYYIDVDSKEKEKKLIEDVQKFIVTYCKLNPVRDIGLNRVYMYDEYIDIDTGKPEVSEKILWGLEITMNRVPPRGLETLGIFLK